MRPIVLACAFAVIAAAPETRAADVQTLSAFIHDCDRSEVVCRAKLRDYLTAAETQHMICRPEGDSLNESVSEMLRWLRHDGSENDDLYRGPYDDALWAAASTLWPCKNQ